MRTCIVENSFAKEIVKCTIEKGFGIFSKLFYCYVNSTRRLNSNFYLSPSIALTLLLPFSLGLTATAEDLP